MYANDYYNYLLFGCRISSRLPLSCSLLWVYPVLPCSSRILIVLSESLNCSQLPRCSMCIVSFLVQYTWNFWAWPMCAFLSWYTVINSYIECYVSWVLWMFKMALGTMKYTKGKIFTWLIPFIYKSIAISKYFILWSPTTRINHNEYSLRKSLKEHSFRHIVREQKMHDRHS